MRNFYRKPRLSLILIALAGCAQQSKLPFVPTDVLELMQNVVAHAAERYWYSITVIVDEDGMARRHPDTDEEWEDVRAAAISIAESGNLLMKDPRAVDDGRWMQLASDLVIVGAVAATAAQTRDPESVLAAGEQVYNVCSDCHALYIVDREPVT